MDYFPVIDLVATGENIQHLRQSRGLTVGDLQQYFGFEQPQAIYKWQKGQCLPKVDHLYALGQLLSVPMEDILVPCQLALNTAIKKDEAFSPGGKIASSFWLWGAALNHIRSRVVDAMHCPA